VNKKIKVLIVDDQPRSRQSLKALLATWPAVAGIREAANGVEALRLAEEHRPDLALIDVRMPEMGGLETTRRIRDRWPGICIVILSMYSDFEPAALAAGADAFVTKGEPPEVLLRILESISENLEQQKSQQS
jgi:YesN/AraC family two-component response regulator